MRTPRHFRFALTCVAGTLVITLSAQERPDAPHPRRDALLRQLDQHVQTRFLDLSRGFGFTRLIPFPSKKHQFEFVPETPGEEDTLSALRSSSLDVALYLASYRTIVHFADDRAAPQGASCHSAQPHIVSERSFVFMGPLVVTADPDKIPAASEALRDQALRAFALVERDGRATFSSNGRNVLATPVRAANLTCLNCHRRDGPIGAGRPGTEGEYRIGDVLGVVLYAHRSH